MQRIPTCLSRSACLCRSQPPGPLRGRPGGSGGGSGGPTSDSDVLKYLGERAAGWQPFCQRFRRIWRLGRRAAKKSGRPRPTARTAGARADAGDGAGGPRDGDLVVEDVIYLWGERAYVSANVVRPRQPAGRLPALVVPPGWLGQLKEEYYRTFVCHMARQGYVLLFIDDPHVGQRSAPCEALYALAATAGTQVMGIQVFDTLRGLDYLLTRADVDPGRIGVAGLCQGSEQTWLAAALDERFRIAVPVCGTTTYEGWAGMPAETGVHLSDPSPYVAGVLRYTDWHEIDACIARDPCTSPATPGTTGGRSEATTKSSPPWKRPTDCTARGTPSGTSEISAPTA